MKYEYINISKCGDWVQSKETLFIYYIYGQEIEGICKNQYINLDYNGFYTEINTHLRNKEIDEIKHYIMNREVFAK